MTRRIVSGAAVVALAIVALTAVMLWRLHVQQLDDGLTDLAALDLLVAAQTERSFDTATLVLDGIADDLQAAGIASPAALMQATGDEASFRLLRAKMAGVPQLDALAIVDANGNVVNRTVSYPVLPPVSFAARDYFLRLRDHPELRHYISPPQQNASDGTWTIYVAERLNAPNGAFLGVLLGAIKLTYFEDVFGGYLKAIAGDDKSIALWRNDGTLLARAPAASAGATAASDGSMRPMPANGLASFWDEDAQGKVAVARRQFENFPLTVELRQSAAAIARQWDDQSLATIAAAATLLLLVGLTLWQLLRHLNAAALAGEERERADREAEARQDIQRAMTRAEAAMRDAQQSEARFRDIIEVGSDWIWETDAQHRFTMILGARRPKVSLIGMTRWEQAGVDPETDEVWRKHKAELDARRPFRQFRFTIHLPTGRFDVCVSGKPIFDDDGTFVGYRGTVSDETELVAAREQAERADALLRNAIESIAEGFVIYDADDRFVMSNDAYRKMYPENANAFVPGTRYEDIMRQALAAGRHPDAVGREDEWLAERIRKHRGSDGPEESQLADGRWILRSERSMPDGGIAGLRIDITALKRAQESLRHNQVMLNQAQRVAAVGSVLRKLKANSVEWSDEMYHLFGLDRETFDPGNTAAFLGHVQPEDRPRVKQAIEDNRRGLRVEPLQFGITRPDGTKRWVLREVEIFHDRDGTPSEFLTTYKDVTDRVTGESRRRELEVLLRDAIESISEGFVIYDAEDRLVLCNDAYRSFYPRSKELLVPGARFEDIVRLAVHDGLYVGAQGREKEWLDDRIRHHRSLNSTVEIELSDGRWMLVSERRTSSGGTAGLRIDITALKASQQALRQKETILSCAQRVGRMGSIFRDFAGNTSHWSDEMFQLLGVSRESFTPSTAAFLAMVHAEDRATVEKSLKATPTRGERDTIQFRIIRTDGSTRWLHREAERLYDDADKASGAIATFQDITELQLAQEALRENQFVLSRAQHIAGIGSVLRKLKTDSVEWSDEMFRLFGLTRDNFDPGDTQAFLALVHPDNRAKLQQAIEDNRRGLPAEPLQFRIIRRDGSLRWVYREVGVFHDSAGKPSEFLTTYKDVTDRVAGEGRLRELEALLRDAIESISEGFVIYDAEDRLVLCNDAYRRLYPEVADLIVPGVYFPDILRAQLTRGDWPQIKGREEEWIAEWQRKRRNLTGTIETRMNDGRWILVTERPMSNGGLAGLRVDITELKNIQQSLRESQQRLDRTQQIAHIGSVERDLCTNEVIWSDETYRIFGVTREEYAPSTENLLALVHPDDRALVMATLRRGEHAKNSMKFRIVRPHGEIRTVFSQADVANDEAGRPLYITVAMMDITEKELASNRQIELEKQLRHSEKLTALGTLAGGIAHDLNNTLVPIQALSRMVMREFEPDAPARADLEIIHQASLQARDLVRQILAFSRKQEIVNAPTDFGAKVRETLQLLRASVPSSIELVERIADVAPILADATQLQQVVVNLVVNAAHAIGNRPGRITVTLDEIFAEGGRTIRFSVADTGCGISPEVIQRMFEPFFTTKDVGEGTGLGLSMVHGIVVGHSGTIDVKSAPGEGTELTILLPAKTAPTDFAVAADFPAVA